MPAVTVEMGYITNPAERALLFDSLYQDKLAAGIVFGHSPVRRLACCEYADFDDAGHHNEDRNARHVDDQDNDSGNVDSQTEALG